MLLNQVEAIRLYVVSTSPDGNGAYKLDVFDDDAFNDAFDSDDLNETLADVANYLYGQGSHWLEVNDDLYNDGGEICLDDDGIIRIRDISRKILTLGDSRIFVVSNVECSECCWIVAEMHG